MPNFALGDGERAALLARINQQQVDEANGTGEGLGEGLSFAESEPNAPGNVFHDPYLNELRALHLEQLKEVNTRLVAAEKERDEAVDGAIRAAERIEELSGFLQTERAQKAKAESDALALQTRVDELEAALAKATTVSPNPPSKQEEAPEKSSEQPEPGKPKK